MEEIAIRSLVAVQHKSKPFKYWKYYNALSIDKIERENGWIEYYATFKRKGILGNWRKGIAIFGQNMLIDKNYNEIAKVNGRLYRIFGGYYANLGIRKYNYITFPGKDRETEYEQMLIINALFDENGNRIEHQQSLEIFKKIDILQSLIAVEVGDDRVFYKNALYNLQDYSLITKFSKNIILDGVFTNGYCKVTIPDDNRDFIVVVHDHKINHVFTEQEFNHLRTLLDLEIKEDAPLTALSPIISNKELSIIENEKGPITIDEYHPIIEQAIEKYLATTTSFINTKGGVYQLSPKFANDFVDETTFWRSKGEGYYTWYLGNLGDRYYMERNEKRCLHISSEKFDQLYKELCLTNNNRPNFIKKITKMGSCAILGKENLYYGKGVTEYEIYRFECRPYGYINTSGELIYDFDVNNIKW